MEFLGTTKSIETWSVFALLHKVLPVLWHGLSFVATVYVYVFVCECGIHWHVKCVFKHQYKCEHSEHTARTYLFSVQRSCWVLHKKKIICLLHFILLCVLAHCDFNRTKVIFIWTFIKQLYMFWKFQEIPKTKTLEMNIFIQV